MECRKCGQAIPIENAAFCPFCGFSLAVKEKSTRKPKSRGNGQGCAYRRITTDKNGKRKQQSTWTACAVVDWRSDPKHPEKPRVPVKRTRGGFKTRADALLYIAELKRNKPKEAPSLRYYWDAYQKGKFKTLSPSKQDAYRIAWDKRLYVLGTTPVDALTVLDIQKTLDKLNLSYYQMKDCKNLLSNLYKIAAVDGFANASLPSLIQLPELEEKERSPFDAEEQKAFWKAYENGNTAAALPLLMIYSGMMPGEAMKLRVDQIDLENRQIRGAGIKTKARKSTPIVIADFLVPVVQTLIDNARPDGHLFVQSKDDFYAIYYGAIESAGVRRLPPYSCRHTTATALAVDSNVAPQTIRKVMRWSSAKMLDRYAHPDTQDALAAVDKLKSKD